VASQCAYATLYNLIALDMKSNDVLTHIMQTYQSREEPERLYALAGVYWRIMLTVEVVLLCAAMAGGAYMLVMTFFNLNQQTSQNSAIQTLSRAQLTQTIQGFQNRQAVFQSLQAAPVDAADPSK
jgi:hypothetical protein